MKKQLSLAMAGVMALSLAACGGSSASSAATSTAEAASSTAESTAESTAAEGDVLDQAAAAAFAQDVTLTMWGAEEDQDLLREISDKFIEKYGNYGGKITINLGAQSEKEAKDTVLTDPTAAADVFAFADDQLNELVQAGALQEVQLNADDIKSRNTPASVDAATVDGKLYAYPLTADNGYFMFYDKSFFTEDDVKSLDTMMEKAAAAGKKVSMDVANGWYLYSFYAGAGLNLSLADDGVNTDCNWNEAPGADVTQAVIDICKNPGFIALKDDRQLVKKYAMVNVQKYQIVATGDSVSECEKNYMELMKQNGVNAETKESDSVKKATGTIAKITDAVVEGNTHQYILLENDSDIYDVSVVDYLDIVRYGVGDTITFEYMEGEQANTVLGIEK